MKDRAYAIVRKTGVLRLLRLLGIQTPQWIVEREQREIQRVMGDMPEGYERIFSGEVTVEDSTTDSGERE